MTVNNFAMQEHQHGYLPLQDDEHDAIRMDSNASDAGDGYITLVNDANETQNDIIQPNSSYNLNETTTKLSENKDEDDYLPINAYTAHVEDCEVTGDVASGDIDRNETTTELSENKD